jgi:hypothetical protein
MKVFYIALLALVALARAEASISCNVCTTAMTVSRQLLRGLHQQTGTYLAPGFCKIFPEEEYTEKCLEFTQRIADNGVEYANENLLTRGICEQAGICQAAPTAKLDSCKASGMKAQVSMALDELCRSVSPDLAAICDKVVKSYKPVITDVAVEIITGMGITAEDMNAVQCNTKVPDFVTTALSSKQYYGGGICNLCVAFWRLPYYYFFTGPLANCQYSLFSIPCDLFRAGSSGRYDCNNFITRILNILYIPGRLLSSPDIWCGLLLNCYRGELFPYYLEDYRPTGGGLPYQV